MKRVDEEPTPEAIEVALTQDPLHRRNEIEDFLKMLIAVEPPYTFVIDAPWGSGKTFFVKQVTRALQMANPSLDPDLETLSATLGETATELPATPCLPIYFNAWEDDHFDNPILPILASIANAVGKESVKEGKDFGKGVIGVLEAAASLIGYSGDINGAMDKFSGADFLARYKEEKELRTKIDELIKKLSAWYSQPSRHLHRRTRPLPTGIRYKGTRTDQNLVSAREHCCGLFDRHHAACTFPQGCIWTKL